MERRNRTTSAAARLTAALLCAVLCLGLAACRRDDGPFAVRLKDNGLRFTVAVSQRPDSFNPLLSQGGLAEEFFLLCYDPLWRLNAAGEPEGCLAEDWSLSSDHLTWTVRLRRDAVFSDGVPVTSADVLFSYELMRRGGTMYSDYFDGVTAIRCPDDYTVVFSTEYVKGDMLYNAAPILPAHIWKEYEFDPTSFDNAALVGSGPFVYDAGTAGDSGWLFLARSDHFSGVPHVDEVFFESYGTITGAARAISTGAADASFGLSDVQLTTLESVPGVALIQAVLPGSECRGLVFNTREDMFFAKDSFRQMLEYSADRDWFLSMSSGGAGVTGSSFMSPGVDGFAAPEGLRGYDPAVMAANLAAIGYRDVDDDGYLEYGSRDSELNLTIYTSSTDGWAATAATILISDLETLGVKADWRKTSLPVTEAFGSRDVWDICTFTWKGDRSAAVTAARFLREAGDLSGWSSEEYSRLLAQLRTAEDPDTVRAVARQLQQLVYDACPVIVLAYGADIQAIRTNIWTGFEDQMSGGLFGTGSYDVYMHVTPRETVG